MNPEFRVTIASIEEIVFVISANSESEAIKEAKKRWIECAYGVPSVIEIEEVIE